MVGRKGRGGQKVNGRRNWQGQKYGVRRWTNLNVHEMSTEREKRQEMKYSCKGNETSGRGSVELLGKDKGEGGAMKAVKTFENKTPFSSHKLKFLSCSNSVEVASGRTFVLPRLLHVPHVSLCVEGGTHCFSPPF